MVEFKGMLSGSAEKRFFQKIRNFEQNVYLVVITLFFPVLAYFGYFTGVWQIIPAYCLFYVMIPLLARIPKTKKERSTMMPQKICVEDGKMYAVTGRGTDTRSVDDVKKIVDHGDFYEVCFRLGRASQNFICQKNLLTKGTLEEFDDLFREKILGY